MRRLLAAALAVAMTASLARAQAPAAAGLPNATDETRAAARELQQASGAEASAKQVLSLMRGLMVQNLQRSSGKPAADVQKIVDDLLLPEMKARVGELSAMLTEVYASNYTADEMRQLTAFYRTPLGQRLIKVGPAVVQQSIVAGQAWGRQVAQDALRKHAEELRSRGINL